jgi:hypothetical protein
MQLDYKNFLNLMQSQVGGEFEFVKSIFKFSAPKFEFTMLHLSQSLGQSSKAKSESIMENF